MNRLADVAADPWRPLVRWGAVAAIVVLVMIPLQAAVFLLSPPPTTVADYFALFQANPLLGLLDLDLLGAASTLLFSFAMLRTRIFGQAAAIVGLANGVTMLVPPNTGGVGLVVAMLSLIPTAVWLVLLARGMLRKMQLTSP